MTVKLQKQASHVRGLPRQFAVGRSVPQNSSLLYIGFNRLDLVDSERLHDRVWCPWSFHIKPVAGACCRLAQALFGQLQPRFWPHGRVLAEVTSSQQLERRFGLRSCKLRWLWARILSGLRASRISYQLT